MVPDGIFRALFRMIEAILSALPDFTPPAWATQHNSAFQMVGQWIGAADAWIDVGLLMTALVLIFAIRIVWAFVWVALFIYDRFPGKAS